MVRYKISRFGWLLAVLILGSVPLSHVFQANAKPLNQRSIRIEHPAPSAVTIHIFNFTVPTNSILGSIALEYCTNNPFPQTPCTPPPGLDVSAANLDSQSGNTGFITDPSTTANRILLTRAPVISNAVPSQYVFSDIVNPSFLGTVYVRISLHTTTDGTGPTTDSGGVVFSTARGIGAQAFVPPYLTFCTGVIVAPDCTSTTGTNINLGELSKTNPRTGTSQFAGATNDVTGFFTNVIAATMTSGSNIINPLSSPATSLSGTSQFGFNLRANNNPSVGQDATGVGDSIVMPDYSVPNQFILKNGVVTSSSLSTDFNVFTASYLVNIAKDQAPGIYSTTITYVATASF